MPVVDSVDYVNRRIYLSSETVNASLDTLDVYREVRALRRLTEDHQKFRPMVVAGGNLPKTDTTNTVPFVQLLNGARLVPFDTSHLITLVRDTFTDDGLVSEQVFDRLPLSASVEVDISVNVQSVEVRLIPVGSAVMAEDVQAISDAVWEKVLDGTATAGDIQRLIQRVNRLSSLIPAAL